jgi:hypothetical protein
MGLPLLSVVCCDGGMSLINAQLGWFEAHRQEIVAPGEREGTGFWGELGALL